MITQGETIPLYGEYVEKKFKLIADIQMQYGNSGVVYQDENGVDRIRIYMSDGQLKYDLRNGGDWQFGGVLTPAGDSQSRFPPEGDSYIFIDGDAFRVVQNGVTQMELLSSIGSQQLDVKNKHIVGVLPSADPSSAVNLEQLLAVVQGDSSDTIQSIDMATRVKCLADQIALKVNGSDAINIMKPDSLTNQLHLAAGATTIQQVQGNASNPNIFSLMGGESARLSLRSNTADQLSLTYKDSLLSVKENLQEIASLSSSQVLLGVKTRYGFDSMTNPLGLNDLLDMKSADLRYAKKSADGNLDMNGNRVINAAAAINSNDLCTLGQLPSHQFIYAFKTSDLQLTGGAYVDVSFDDAVLPTALSPPISQAIQPVSTRFLLRAGVYKITHHTVMTYSKSTQNPVRVELVGTIDGVIVQSRMQAPNVDSYSRAVHCERCFIMRVAAQQEYGLRIHITDTFASYVKAGTSLQIELLQ